MNDLRIYSNTIRSRSETATYIMSSSYRLNDNSCLEYLVSNYKNKHVVIFHFLEENERNNEFLEPYLFDLKRILKTKIESASIINNINEIESLLFGDIILDMEYLKERKKVISKVKLMSLPTIIFEDNILVPVEVASNKEEYSARTIRPKISKIMDDFITPIDLFSNSLGENYALKKFNQFIDKRLGTYDERSNPMYETTSELSVALKYGFITPSRILQYLESINSNNKAAFIEELIIRRELAYNFVHYNKNYNDFYSITYDWAYQSMALHRYDKREYLYSLEDYISFKTHDKYFNTAMKEMIYLGKMHGYMRMYWCKKIIEWSSSYEEAYSIAIYLNNYYFLDGNTPNGYCGVAWCFGKHDRAWKEREIFGKIRYMNAKGLERKFNMDAYIKRIEKDVRNNETY